MDGAGTPAQRDCSAALIRYNQQLVGRDHDPRMLATKFARMAVTPFHFFRGSFHLFVADWQTHAAVPSWSAPAQPIVGDLHLENFGAYRDAHKLEVFDVNDFDETGRGPAVFDLARLCTSLVLADEHALTARVVARIEHLVEAWFEGGSAKTVGPLHDAGGCRPIQRLLSGAKDERRGEWLDARVHTVHGRRVFMQSDRYRSLSDDALRNDILAGLQTYGVAFRERSAKSLAWPTVLDIATRVAGTGSLGRLRYVVLIESKNAKRGKERVLELKEALPSALAPTQSDQAERVVAHQRLLQAEPPAFLGVARVRGRAFTVRELQPTEAKLSVEHASANELDAVLPVCGGVLGRLHARGGLGDSGRNEAARRSLTRGLCAYAMQYADKVVADYRTFLTRRGEIEHALGLDGTAAHA